MTWNVLMTSVGYLWSLIPKELVTGLYQIIPGGHHSYHPTALGIPGRSLKDLPIGEEIQETQPGQADGGGAIEGNRKKKLG